MKKNKSIKFIEKSESGLNAAKQSLPYLLNQEDLENIKGGVCDVVTTTCDLKYSIVVCADKSVSCGSNYTVTCTVVWSK